MGTFIRYVSLFFAVFLAESLQVSVFRYGYIVLALLLFFVFFLRPHVALFSACAAGFLEDIIVGPFGFHIIVYPAISLISIGICATLLTNKSFVAFLLLESAGFVVYYAILVAFSFFGEIFYQQEILVSFIYAKEAVFGYLAQIAFSTVLFGFQYRRVRFSRAYLMFSR